MAEFDARLRFSRDAWRLLVGEVLLVTAAEMPELPELSGLETVLAPGRAEAHQALHGSRELRFGAAVYRPGRAGLNDADDVSRLAAWLGAVRPEAWTADGLAGGAEERAEELAYLREWFEVLRGAYLRAAGAGRVMVLESIY